MAKQYLIDIGMNDELEDVIRKANMNFRLLSKSASQASSASIRNANFDTTQSIAEIREDLLSTEERLRADMNTADQDLRDDFTDSDVALAADIGNKLDQINQTLADLAVKVKANTQAIEEIRLQIAPTP